MVRLHFKSFAVGAVLGVAVNVVLLRRSLKRWSDAIERGDFDEAQRQLRRAYLTNFRVWLRRPPGDESNENDEE